MKFREFPYISLFMRVLTLKIFLKKLVYTMFIRNIAHGVVVEKAKIC